MSIVSNEYISLYLLGCLLVMILTFFKFIIFRAVAWFSKANVLVQNLKKIEPPDKKSLARKIGYSVALLIVETLVSWINVVVIIWQIISGVFGVIREAVSSVPEEIKSLRFPLRNNP